MRMRKRVTLMAVSVSAIFAVCWLTDSISYILSFYTAAHTFNDVTYVATSIMIMLNAAINPIIYALVSKQFRDKIKVWSPFYRRRPRIANRRSQIAESSAIVWNRMETLFGDRSRWSYDLRSSISFDQLQSDDHMETKANDVLRQPLNSKHDPPWWRKPSRGRNQQVFS